MTTASDVTLQELRENGHSVRQIGNMLGMPKSTVHDRLARLRDSVHNPDFTVVERFEGDCVVVGDVHVPTTDFDFAKMVSVVGKEELSHKVPKTLIICGDLINADAYSKYSESAVPNSFDMELDLTQELLMGWGETFDRIIYTMGNHERRLFVAMRGMFQARHYQDLLGGHAEVFREGSIEILSGGKLWRATHPMNYRRNTGMLGDILAQKYQCNVIVHHEHHVGIRRDSYNRYTVINNGGLHDHKAMLYVHEADNTSPVMQNSFVVIRNGLGKLFTPYDTITDWSSYA